MVTVGQQIFGPAANLGQKGTEIFSCIVAGKIGHHLGRKAISHFLHDIVTKVAGCAVVHFGKTGRDLCLQRIAAQQGCAKAVDRLNTQAAGRFNRAGK